MLVNENNTIHESLIQIFIKVSWMQKLGNDLVWKFFFVMSRTDVQDGLPDSR